jgi:hypothetical protein
MLPLAIVLTIASADAPPLTIAVTGRGSVEAKPDVAFVILYVRETGVLPSDAFDRARDKVARVEAALRELGTGRFASRCAIAWNSTSTDSASRRGCLDAPRACRDRATWPNTGA